MLTSYFDCSDVLKPYLFKYLGDAANDNRRAYHGTAMICLQNIRKTFKYGGRKVMISAKEIDAITNGKNLKRQIYHLPGGMQKVINTKAVTVVEEVLQELCTQLNVLSPLEQQEYSLCYVVESESVLRQIPNDEYILDKTTELENEQRDFCLLLKRTVWIHPLRLDSDLYIDVMFHQIMPDYLEGLLVIMKSLDSIAASTMDDIALLGALLHRAEDNPETSLVNERTVLKVLPLIVQNVHSVTTEQWGERVNTKLRQLPPALLPLHARAKFLEVLQEWPLFGSTTFHIPSVSDPRISGDSLLAVNKHGLQFLHSMTHETLLEFRLSEIVSTQKSVAQHPNGYSVQYLDVKVGNMLQQVVLKIETDQATDIARLIGQYIYVDSQNRGFISGGGANGPPPVFNNR